MNGNQTSRLETAAFLSVFVLLFTLMPRLLLA
jgi:hypothetical protein